LPDSESRWERRGLLRTRKPWDHRVASSLLSVILMIGFLISLPSSNPRGGATGPVKVEFGQGVYPEERWERGKLRRWISSSGELLLINEGPPITLDVRFVAESFRIRRLLRAIVGNTVLLEAAIPPSAPLFVSIKRVPVKTGTTVLTLAPAEPADQVGRFLATKDTRRVTVAIGPVSLIDSTLPDAAREETGAFPDWQTRLPVLAPAENESFNLCQQGRLLEAWYVLRPVIASGHGHPLAYAVGGITALALDDLDGATSAFGLGSKARGNDLYAVLGRRVSGILGPYLDRSEMLLSRSADPGRAFRQRGEIYRAVSLYQTILGRDSANPQATYWLGFLDLLGVHYLDARSLFRTFIATRPNTEDARVLKDLLFYVPH